MLLSVCSGSGSTKKRARDEGTFGIGHMFLRAASDVLSAVEYYSVNALYICV